MKKLILTFLFLSTIYLYSQTDSTQNNLQDSLRCLRITNEVEDSLIHQFSTLNFEYFFPMIQYRIDSCGYHEHTLRSIIMEEIITGNPVDLAISDYFEAGYFEVYKNRITDAQEFNHYDYYIENVEYYGYLPLDSKLDSVIKQRAIEWKDSVSTDFDPYLILRFFSDDYYTFESEATKKEYKKSYIGGYVRKLYREERNQFLGMQIHTGIFGSKGLNQTLGISQILGFGLSTPLSKKWVGDFFINFRFSYNPKEFNFYAMNTLNPIKSHTVSNIEGRIGYRILDLPVGSKTIMIHPKVGLGVDFISTGLFEQVGEEEYRYYNPSTLHTLLGLSASIPMFKTSYLGIGFYYHYIPYHWDKRVKSKMDDNYLSVEIFFRL